MAINKKEMKEKFIFQLFCVAVILILFQVAKIAAHEEDIAEEEQNNFFANPVFYIKLTGIWAVFIAMLILLFRNFVMNNKKLFFWLLITPIILSSLYLAGATIYENIFSETKGPIHWHADYQIWICGERLQLIDPEGIANRVGSAFLHEHNDNRIHIEGTVEHWEDIDLGSYFASVGGELEMGHFIFSTNEKIYDVINGDDCNGEEGTLKVYVNGGKIDNYENYLIYPDSQSPPGDCVIVLFDETNSETTDKICESWQAKGWGYDNFKRREMKKEEKNWQ